MIETLQNDDIIRKVGGRFKLTALIQKRWLELLQGARPMVDTSGLTPMEVVIEEILQDKVTIDFEASGIESPPEA
ncbi:MAG: DNA-directed RNA polymerase subunit omega [Planctomycetota bacterium]